MPIVEEAVNSVCNHRRHVSDARMHRRLRICLCALLLAGGARLEAEQAADLVAQHANVLTIDERLPRAQAFAVREGRFVVVGSDADVAGSIGEHTTVLDLRGKTVAPGFVDAHSHPGTVYPENSRWASVDCRPDKTRTMQELVAALKHKADQTAPGEWVLGSRYQDTKLGRDPTRLDLDQASTAHPIIVSHCSGHQSVCNSLALEMAKVTAETRDPPGGQFVRDDQGRPNGVLKEGAAGIVRAAMVNRPAPPQAELMEGYRAGYREYLSRGVTSIGVAGASPEFGRLLERARTDELPLRLNIMLNQSSIRAAVQRKAGGRPGDVSTRYGAIKIFHGGSVSAHTCWVSQPYVGRPEDFGLRPARSQEALNALILSVHEAGLQACVHCNGDREIEMVLNAFEEALKKAPRKNHRHRLEHGSVLTPALVSRIKELELVVVPHSYLWELGDTMDAYGEDRWDSIHAARWLIEAGIPIAGHSDSPVSTADPLRHIQAMVTRKSADGTVYGAMQRVTVEQALRVWTLGGAYASFDEDVKGSIAPGKLADFVVLGADPASVDPDRIQDIPLEKTFIGGRQVFQKP
jgi:predicted amidohydrolase YtcJ